MGQCFKNYVGSTNSCQALLLAKHNDRVYERLRQNTKSIVFFATPHRGGNGTTIGQIAVNVVKFFTGNLKNDLVESLQKKLQDTCAALSRFFPSVRGLQLPQRSWNKRADQGAFPYGEFGLIFNNGRDWHTSLRSSWTLPRQSLGLLGTESKF